MKMFKKGLMSLTIVIVSIILIGVSMASAHSSAAPRPTSTPTASGPTATPAATATPSGNQDPFGIAMLHPSIGRTWFNLWNQGTQRTFSFGWNPATDPELVFRGNGNYTIYGASGTRAGQMQVTGKNPRIYVRSTDSEAVPPPDGPKWNNVEVTFYAYSSGASTVGWAGIEAVAKTNHLPDSWNCGTRGYGGRMLFDGRVDLEKEVSHSNPEINVQKPPIYPWPGGGPLPLKQWIGFKLVARNIDNGNDGNWQNDTKVQVDLYRDMSIVGDIVNPTPPANGGNWELLYSYIDDGNWTTGYGNCTPDPGTTEFNPDRAAALTWPNWSVYLRTDGLSSKIPQYYKWFSVREIAPLP